MRPWLLVAVLVLLAGEVCAQRSPAPAPAKAPKVETPFATEELPTVEQLEAMKAGLEALPEQTDVSRRAVELYAEAIASIAKTREWEEARTRYAEELRAVPGELEAVRAELAAPPEGAIEVPADATLDAVRQSRDQANAALTAAQEKVRELEEVQQKRATRRGEIPRVREEIRLGLEDVEERLAAPPVADEAAEVSKARRTAQLAKLRLLRTNLEAIDQELANYEARTELLPLRRERWSRRLVARERAAQEWREVFSKREKAKAEEEAAAARRALTVAHPNVREIAEQNLRLADLRTGPEGILARKTAAQQAAVRLERELEGLRKRFEQARERAGIAALGDLVGVQLRRERSDLASRHEHEDSVAARRRKIADAQLRWADIEFELETLPPLVERKEQILATIEDDLSQSQRAEIEAELDRLLTEQRERYTAIVRDYEEYLEEPGYLILAQATEQQIVESREAFRDFIDEHILWIRSSGTIRGSDAGRAWIALRDLISPANWSAVGADAMASVRATPVRSGIVVVAIVLLLLVRSRLRRRLVAMPKQIRRAATDRMAYTMRALGITLMLAAVWPLLLWFVAWRLDAADGAADFSLRVAAGLYRAGIVLLALGFLRQLCRKDGLADAHFRWRQGTRRVLLLHVSWLVPALIVPAFLIAASDWEGGDAAATSLARFAYLARIIALGIFVAVVLRPRGGVMEGVLARSQGGWLDRLRYVWYPLVLGVPVALCVLTVLGYFYTAIQLDRALVQTYWLLLLLILVNGLILRWLMIARRRILLEEARKRAEENLKRAEQAKRDDKAKSESDAAVVFDEPKLDITAIDTQVRRMVRNLVGFGFILGVWLIWFNMLPALKVLNRVELYPDPGLRADTSMVVAAEGAPRRAAAAATAAPKANGTGDGGGEKSPAAGIGTILTGGSMSSADSSEDQSAAADDESILTLADVLLAIVIVVITILFTRNLPGMMEITVLQRLPLEPSGRYAVTTLARYTLAIVGIMLAFGAIGIGWSKVQWLAAAVTVGLGFGLQEIFANFVSGIIILFERPIRVGDTVTVGNISGTVTRLRIRATTITDWDRKELIIPNKEFVTGQIVNWSLSDATLRVSIPVGIAYGSDTKLARETLLRVAHANAAVLDDPAPSAVFTDFGDSTLNFKLRVFIPSIEYFVSVRDQLHGEIDDAFREQGIEIAFPQRDLHIRTVPSGFPAGVTIERAGEAVSSHE